jgi:hypothetical protein
MGTDEGLLPTKDVLQACKAATGVDFSVHQLGDWVTEGLLPPSRPGPGRGKRVGGTGPRLWEAECVPRLNVIAITRTGKNISVYRAASALAREGYSPGPKHLRPLLSHWLAEWRDGTRAPLEWNRTFLKQNLPTEEKRKRFHRSDLRRYGTTVNPALRARVERLKLAALGLAEATEGDPLDEVIAAFTYDRVNAALQEASNEALEGAFRIANALAPDSLPGILGIYTVLAGMVGPLSAALSKHDAEDFASLLHTMHELASADPVEFASELRLPFTLLVLYLVYLHHLDPTTVDTLVTQIDAALHQLIALLTQHMEDSARAMLQAMLASAMSSAIGTPNSQADQAAVGEQPVPDVREEQAKPDMP